ncbi:MAG TPA: chemotaxis-specific protein-glutamate methyltransferase CheB [Solirubrobacteraceae bacterium]|jgi:two-component system chemotaxis response regulator CheB|nr:chemotaxis-specific protein-glutamate methyltransferase CheB [Solirubrobacteraceae bacterium]
MPDAPVISPARVVVADDSALMRSIVSRSLERAGVDVVGSARNGDEALELCERERPDAMTLDLTMPGLDGLGVLRALRERPGAGIPVVVVSAFSAAHGARAIDALAEGAFDLVPKPAANQGLEGFIEVLGAKVRLAAASHRLSAFKRPPRPVPATVAAAEPEPPRAPATTGIPPARAVIIATSTGGPRALAALMPELPCPLGIGTLIVQHMPAGFTESLASRLDCGAELHVREAGGGERLDPRTALIAPGGRHLRLSGDGHIAVSDAPAVGGLRPRADLLIEDAARVYGPRLLLVVLTGMGNDGLRGAGEVRRQGGRVLVESEDSCTVYGMPRAIVDHGLADDVLTLDRLAGAIAEEAGR